MSIPIPHQVIDTTRDYCRYIKALLIRHQSAITKGGTGLRYRECRVLGFRVLAFRV